MRNVLGFMWKKGYTVKDFVGTAEEKLEWKEKGLIFCCQNREGLAAAEDIKEI